MMKKILLFLLCLCSVLSLWAEPYGLLINGTTKLEATPLSEKDYQGREQYKVSCVELNQGDKVQLCDFGNNDATWMCGVDSYGEYQKFAKKSDHLICNAAGSYDFYIKLKYENDLLYIGPAEQCGGTTPNPDPEPDPDPNAKAVPSACPDVMLQGFYWDSNRDASLYGNTRWKTLQGQATEIASYFDLVWLPPSAMSSGGVGYLPKQYSNQNSDWGTRADLEKLIKTLHDGGAKVIADIVINHIDGKSSWCSFYEQDFGEYGKFQVDGSYICRGDEMNTDPSAGSCKNHATGPNDDGYAGEANYGAARDLAHDSEVVREMCRAYTKWMINEMQYDGFRYDYCKGYHMSHVSDYNTYSGAKFSVMEYWDGNADNLCERIADAYENSLAFDFSLKYNALNDGICAYNYSKCKAPGLLGKGKSKWAVTFVDNHDTHDRSDSEFGGQGNSMSSTLKDCLLQANAFILSMPGVPCVYYPHWKKYGTEIKAMITARKMAGVHSESHVSDEADNSGYRAYVTGSKAKLVIELGNRVSTSRSGYTKMASGNGYAMWVENTDAVKPELDIHPNSMTYRTETLTVTMSAMGGLNGTPSIYYTLDGTDPRTSATRKTYTTAITITGTVTLKAYAVSGNAKSEVCTREYTYLPPQEGPITVAFRKPDTWAKVHMYSWLSNATKLTGEWPGQELTEKNDAGFYYYTFADNIKEVYFIFNNGAKVQSADLVTYEDACYGWENDDAVLIHCEQGGTTDVENAPADDASMLDVSLPMYNILGQQVDATYKGLVIQNGRKFFNL